MSGSPKSSTSQRTRAPNFTAEEQQLLCDVLKPYLHIIESKKTDGVKHSQKQIAWKNVADIYNSNTKHVFRTTENLILCYRNMKAKIKKDHSNAKMNITDASERSLITAIEENGEDWETVSQITDKPIEECKASFKELAKNYLKEEKLYKRKVLGTGGGPPPSDEDNPMKKLKSIIEPQVDGLFTIYDGDADIMEEFQMTLPASDRIVPVEHALVTTATPSKSHGTEEFPITVSCSQLDVGTDIKPLDRQTMLKKTKSTELRTKKNCNKTCNSSFQTLAEAKLELVKLQTEMASADFQHKQKIQELELQNLIAENRFKEEMRTKELELIDLKIKKLHE